MTISTKLVGCLLLSGLCATALQATAATPGEWYTGVKAGWSDYYNADIGKNLSSEAEGSYTLHGSNAIGGAFLGYQVIDWLGVEGGYDYLGNASFSSPTAAGANLEGQGIQLGVKMSLPLSDDMSVYGRLGMMGWVTKVKSNGQTNTDNGISPLAALGTEFSLSDKLALRLEYQYTANMGNGGDNGVELDNGQTSLGVIYRFGHDDIQPAPQALTPVKPPEIQSVTLKTSVGFDSGSTEMNEADQRALHAWSQEVVGRQLTEAKLTVSGYADRTGSAADNQSLSEARANRVADEIRSQPGMVIPASVSGQGVSMQTGSSCEKISNHRALVECLSPDRRVDITLIGKQKQPPKS